MKRQSSFIRALSVFLAFVLTAGFLPAEALEGGRNVTLPVGPDDVPCFTRQSARTNAGKE